MPYEYGTGYAVVNQGKPSSDNPDHAVDVSLTYDDILSVLTALRAFVEATLLSPEDASDEDLILAANIRSKDLPFYQALLDEFE